MEIQEIELNGRKYKAYVSPEDSGPGAYVIIGPPEGLVDNLEFPEPFATRLHNIMYERGIFTAKEATRKNAMLGVLQDALQVDAQKIVEKFLLLERETLATGG